MSTHPPIDDRPLDLQNSGGRDTASDWSAANLLSPASYRSRAATPAGTRPVVVPRVRPRCAIHVKVSVGVLLVSIPTGLVFVRHQVRAGVQNLFPDWRFVTIKTLKTQFFFIIEETEFTFNRGCEILQRRTSRSQQDPVISRQSYNFLESESEDKRI